MADTDRDEKIAAARKRLKKFQQKRTPSSSPAVKKTPKNKPLNDSNLSFTSSDSPIVSSAGPDDVQDNINPTSVATGTENSSTERNSHMISDESESFSAKQKSFSPLMADKSHVDSVSAPFSNGQSYTNGSTAEKIRQICNQLNGLTNQDFMINGEDPVITEIEALESRNHELEESLLSFKRSNEQLNNQVNEQRKQILHFQDQIKRERTELANRQLLEQRTLKEQLEVHIQTIGILVGEKQELQSSLSQLHRKFVNKESENSELTGRLQAVRQKIVECEKSNASLTASLDKYKEDFNHVRQERDKYQTANYTHGKNKEELLQQIEELKVKLDIKVSENGSLVMSNSEISFKLTQAELIVQQLSTEPRSAVTQSLAAQLQKDKNELENKLEQVSKSLKKYELDNEELHQRHSDEVDQFENRIRTLKEQVTALDTEKKNWENEEMELNEKMQALHVQLGEMQDEEAFERQEASSMVAAQIEKLSTDKQELVHHLQNEAMENAKLKKMENKYLHQIHELELNLSRLEEDVTDRTSLLESVQSDKETISRALTQNKDLKEKLEEIEDKFVKLTNDNMELTNQRDKEKHVARELAIKLSETAVELEEAKDKLSKNEEELYSKSGELQSTQDQLNGSSTEVDSLRTEHELSIQRLKEQLAHKDFELSSLREEVSTTVQRLETTQAQTNEFYTQYEEQSHKMQSMFQYLQTSEETINQMASENKHLRTIIDSRHDNISEHSDSSSSADEQHEHPTHHINGDALTKEEELSSDESLHIKGRLSPQDTSSSTPDLKMSPDGSYINGGIYEGTKEDTDSSEEMDMAPQDQRGGAHQISKYTSREDVVEGLSVSIRQLEMERDQLTHLIHSYQETHQHELQRLQEHMELQLQQQLQHQYRQVQEQFQQNLHEQQQKILLLQEVLQKQKSHIEKQSEEADFTSQSLGDSSLSFEALKVAFNKLQNRFKDLMDEKAALQDRVQELEHLTDQLSFETETIEEYVTLYQTQRTSLKNYYNEREKIITQLSNEKGHMQDKISQLQSLVKQLIDERQALQQQLHQLQAIVNKRMVVQEHANMIPTYQDNIGSPNDDLLKTDESSSINMDSSLDSGRESPLHINDLESMQEPIKEDGTTRQILQLLEQLGPSDEGEVRGWLSPTVRSREFLPCRYCTDNRLIQI